MPNRQAPPLASLRPPSRGQELTALGVAALLFALFFLTFPFARIEFSSVDVFIPIFAAMMMIINGIIAALFFAQFSLLRSGAPLVLAIGYLFTALIAIALGITVPGAFTANGLLGAGSQMPPWLFVIWRIVFYASFIVYAFLNRAPGGTWQVQAPVGTAILASVAGTIALVCGVTWVLVANDTAMPALVTNSAQLGGAVEYVFALILLLGGSALLLLLFWRRSVLDLWLAVAALAWLLDTILLSVSPARYTVGWYLGRLFGIAAVSFVLYVMLAESPMLGARRRKTP